MVNLALTILVVSFGITFMIMSARILNALSLGEETAITLGVKAISCRYSIMIVGTLIVEFWLPNAEQSVL